MSVKGSAPWVGQLGELMIGNVIGNYKIVEKIGEGGMGAVYKGVDMMLERDVAIKALKPELARQPHIVERFRAEAVTLAKLSHPNIATLHTFLREVDRKSTRLNSSHVEISY